MVLAAVDVVDCLFHAGAGIRGLYVTGVQTCALPIVLAHRGGDGGVVVGAGDGDVDVMGCGAVEGCDDEVVVDDLARGGRLRHCWHVAVAPGAGGGGKSIGAIGAGLGGGRLEMVLAAVDVVDGEGAGRAGIAGGCVGHAAVFEDRVVLAHRGGDGGVVVGEIGRADVGTPVS